MVPDFITEKQFTIDITRSTNWMDDHCLLIADTAKAIITDSSGTMYGLGGDIHAREDLNMPLNRKLVFCCMQLHKAPDQTHEINSDR